MPDSGILKSDEKENFSWPSRELQIYCLCVMPNEQSSKLETDDNRRKKPFFCMHVTFFVQKPECNSIRRYLNLE